METLFFMVYFYNSLLQKICFFLSLVQAKNKQNPGSIQRQYSIDVKFVSKLFFWSPTKIDLSVCHSLCHADISGTAWTIVMKFCTKQLMANIYLQMFYQSPQLVLTQNTFIHCDDHVIVQICKYLKNQATDRSKIWNTSRNHYWSPVENRRVL